MSNRFAIAVAAGIGLMSVLPAQAKEQSGQTFLEHAIGGDLAEVQLGKLAQEKGGSQGVRDFGKTLETDHSAAQQKASELAQSMGVTPPGTPPKKAQRDYDKLSKLSGAKFDREFLRHAVRDHKRDIAQYTKESKRQSDGQVAQLAQDTLPTLEKHLQMAESLEKKEKAAK